MHVYIAGGAGAIGTRLVRQLVERGHRVTATTRDPAKTGSAWRGWVRGRWSSTGWTALPWVRRWRRPGRTLSSTR